MTISPLFGLLDSFWEQEMIEKTGHQIQIINPEQMAKLITEERKIDY